MGSNRPLTFGPDEMAMLRDVVLNGQQEMREGGGLEIVEDFAKSYMDDLSNRPKLKNKLKVVAACGNGTAGAFAPHVLKAIGCEVIEMDCDLDHSFPNYNPNPEDLKMLHALRDRVLETGADVGLAFDGDGDRCGVVDETGNEIFADKVGVMLARDISAIHDNKQFVVDVKSTGLFKTDPVLNANGAETDYFKTGHSYIKRRVTDLNAIVGFEKSGHFFFNAPIGRGYDDGILSALAVCDMLDRNPDKKMSDLYNDLPKTYGSPTMSAKCADEIKYEVVDRVVAKLSSMVEAGESLGGHKLIDAVTVNGIRVTAEDGTWGLVRASSNKPEIVVVIESPASQERLEEMFAAVDAVLRENPEVGAYNQTLKG
jgi:phosphomannomutase/phosphoglucomutase